MGSYSFWEDDRSIAPDVAATFYNYFAYLFLEPLPVPGGDSVGLIKQMSFDLFAAEQEDCPGFESLPGLKEALSFFDFADDQEEQVQKELAVDRTYLCRGVDPDGLTPPYASFWSQSGAITLSQTMNIYRDTGFFPSEDSGERLDYLGMEFALLAMLAQGECEASASSDTERASFMRTKRIEFLTEHLQKWLPAYCKKAVPYAKTRFFKGILTLMPALFLSAAE